jgi:hypothetical protein
MAAVSVGRARPPSHNRGSARGAELLDVRLFPQVAATAQCFSPSMQRAVAEEARRCDAVHIHCCSCIRSSLRPRRARRTCHTPSRRGARSTCICGGAARLRSASRTPRAARHAGTRRDTALDVRRGSAADARCGAQGAARGDPNGGVGRITPIAVTRIVQTPIPRWQRRRSGDVHGALSHKKGLTCSYAHSQSRTARRRCVAGDRRTDDEKADAHAARARTARRHR